jgi:hypothetical protein
LPRLDPAVRLDPKMRLDLKVIHNVTEIVDVPVDSPGMVLLEQAGSVSTHPSHVAPLLVVAAKQE